MQLPERVLSHDMQQPSSPDLKESLEPIISDVGAFIMTSLVKLVGSSIQSDSLQMCIRDRYILQWH